MARIVPATQDWIELAAATIRSGGIAAFPTETVYGLGASALNERAVARVFAAKGRPATNPVIVHIAEVADLDELCAAVPDSAHALAQEFWPGPLTFVLPKSSRVPDIVTAGGETIGVRMPKHPVALALLQAARTSIAAPSANRSEEVSPTTAQHVASSLGDAVDLVLDGGPCAVGIESTVLDLSSDTPQILRPGIITAAQIEAVLGIVLARPNEPSDSDAQVVRSPGRMPRHYAPKKPLSLVPRSVGYPSDTPGAHSHLSINGYCPLRRSAGAGTPAPRDGAKSLLLPLDPQQYARNLYAILHDFDNDPAVVSIEVEEPPDTPEWAAIRDRLRRAAAPRA